MPRRQFRSFIRLCAATAIGLALSVGLSSAQAQERELKVGYMKNPIQDASLDIMEKWAKDHGVKLTRVPMAYSVFMEKVTTTLTTGTDQFDVIWHNDDWGQLWKKWLDTTDDIKGIENADRWPLLAFWTEEKKLTVVPMAHTVGTFFYRSDLVKPEEVPKTFDQLVSVSQRLQKEGKVKWGYVGGMSMNNPWFSFWWTMWANNCDILRPLFERDNDKLAAAKFEPAVTEPCHREIVDFWWDAINTHKISPPGMTAYGRNEANAIFMAGDAAFTLVDSTHFGEFNDPKRSKIVGKVGMAPFPVGPRAQKPTSWNEIWGWAVPKGVPAERSKLAKEMLSAMMSDETGQVEMWKKTGGPPPNVKLWPKLAADDKDFAALKHAVFDQTPITHSAYYFAEWPAVHKAYSDMAIAALSGKREDIPKVLAELVLVLFQVVPILTGANASFRDWTLHDPKRTWVGLANYVHVLRDPDFLGIVLPNTFGFMVASVACSLLLGLMIALMLNKRFPGRWLVQSFVLLPLMAAPVIAAIMIPWMFNDQFGVRNAALEGLGISPFFWLTRRGP